MSEENTTTPATAPVATTAVETPATPVVETPVAGTPAAQPASTDNRPKIVKKFFKERPKQDRPKLDFTEVSTGVKLRQLDAEIDAELAAAMSGFDDKMTVDVKTAQENAAKPKAGGGRF